MERRLPDEILAQILSHLSPRELAVSQLVCHRFLVLSRDNKLWKSKCFIDSRAEALRRRQELIAIQEPSLAALRRAMDELNYSDREERSQRILSSRKHVNSKARAMANWDPVYPGEQVDFYQEYIHRHGQIKTNWLPAASNTSSALKMESVGVGIVEYGAERLASQVLSPLEDGSVCLWDIRPFGRVDAPSGSIVARSNADLVFDGSSAKVSNETGAVDNVSIDSLQGKAYIAAFDNLNEVDLHTFQVLRRQKFPFPVTCLSDAQHPTPLTVGTNMTIHLYDTRTMMPQLGADCSTRCELIAGGFSGDLFSTKDKVSSSHALLSQPGPLSILHLSKNPLSGREPTHDIWVAGRFTSLLNYDRRVWPRVKGTIFSGARLSSLSSLPFPYLPQEMDLSKNETATIQGRRNAKSVPGSTLIAAGEYKGKGSLELYGLAEESLLEDRNMLCSIPGRVMSGEYRNRQTVSKSRLLSTCPHMTRLVFSDGDGNLKWTERDGVTGVRSININSDAPDQERGAFDAPRSEEVAGDIVQKIIPVRETHSDGRMDQQNLLIWTGEGRVGMVSFGSDAPWIKEGSAGNELESDEEEESKRQEEAYARHMRRALEKQADETRFVRGLGMAMGM